MAVNVLRSSVYPVQWMRHDMLWNGVEEDGNVKS
jgi:hypothetical protein